MQEARPRRLIRIATSAAMLSLFALNVPSMAQAATAHTPTAISVKTSVVAPSPLSDPYTAEVLRLINEKRAAVGSAPVKWNQSIGNVSQGWAVHLGQATMDPNFDWSKIHRSDAGGSLIPAGATWYRENIAFASSPASIVNWWMGSEGHRIAMLDPRATDIGLGYVVPASGPYAGWHQVVTNLAAYPNSTTPTAPITGTVPAGTQYKTTIWLNLRSGPGTNYGIIGSGVSGTTVTATGKTSGIWYEVKLGAQTGWMSSEYLSKVSVPTPVPVPQTPIAIKAASLNGALGSAVGGEVYGLKDNGSYQCFQLGCILHSPASGARVSTGAIRTTWASTGFESGRLGYPVTDEVRGLKNGGAYQNYQGGAIIWSPKTGAQISVGAIRDAWAATGFENGGLGYPVTGEIGGLRNGGAYQNYEGGSIIWSPNTGAKISVGGIRTVWAASGYENGVLGYPTSNEVGGLRDGGVYQMYEGGAILWSPATGGHISKGGIRSIWANTGFENGRLGYPTSNEYSTGPGGQVAQNYQGGTIHWGPSGNWIAYK